MTVIASHRSLEGGQAGSRSRECRYDTRVNTITCVRGHSASAREESPIHRQARAFIDSQQASAAVGDCERVDDGPRATDEQPDGCIGYLPCDTRAGTIEFEMALGTIT